MDETDEARSSGVSDRYAASRSWRSGDAIGVGSIGTGRLIRLYPRGRLGVRVSVVCTAVFGRAGVLSYVVAAGADEIRLLCRWRRKVSRFDFVVAVGSKKSIASETGTLLVVV
jgi:hypothetical protein